jgi:hypothetical protein
MSLELGRQGFLDAQNYKEPATVVHIHGFGVDNTDTRQRVIADHLVQKDPELKQVMPEMCDIVDGDILVKLSIGAQVRKLLNVIEKIEGPKIIAAHSQGTVAAAEVVANHGDQLEIIDSFWMGPALDLNKEMRRLEGQAEDWGAEIDVIQHVQARLPQLGDAEARELTEMDVLDPKNIQHYIHYRPSAIDKPPTDVVLTNKYVRSLGEHASRHIENLRTIWAMPNISSTIITAGEECVTDGTYEEVRRLLSDIDGVDSRLFQLEGANHRFGGGYREAIANIMRDRSRLLRSRRALGAHVLSHV